MPTDIQLSGVAGASDDADALCRRMVLVCGTSTCHMAVSHERHFIPGVWGPFWSGTSLITR